MTNDDEQKRQASEARQQGVFIFVLAAIAAVVIWVVIEVMG